MKKSLVALALLCFLVRAGAEAPPGWQNRYSVVGGTEVWIQPSGPITSPTEATFTATAGGGVTALSAIAPVLADGRAVALSVYRAVTGSELLAAGARLLGNPSMVASAATVAYLLAKVPSFGTWISGDGGANIRIGPTTGQIEKRDTNALYQTSNYCIYATLEAAVACAWPNRAYRNDTGTTIEVFN